MFKKPDEQQEWTRFRGALQKDREEPTTAAPADAAGPSSKATSGNAGSSQPVPSARSQEADAGPATGLADRPTGSDGQTIESTIGEQSTFEGTLHCEGPIRVVGKVQGILVSKAAIFVEETAAVSAALTASQVTVAGKVDGQIHCQGRVEIRPTGRVTGEIHAGALIVQEGAFFEGNSRMASGAEASPPPEPAQAAQPAASTPPPVPPAIPAAPAKMAATQAPAPAKAAATATGPGR